MEANKLNEGAKRKKGYSRTALKSPRNQRGVGELKKRHKLD